MLLRQATDKRGKKRWPFAVENRFLPCCFLLPSSLGSLSPQGKSRELLPARAAGERGRGRSDPHPLPRGWVTTRPLRLYRTLGWCLRAGRSGPISSEGSWLGLPRAPAVTQPARSVLRLEIAAAPRLFHRGCPFEVSGRAGPSRRLHRLRKWGSQQSALPQVPHYPGRGTLHPAPCALQTGAFPRLSAGAGSRS